MDWSDGNNNATWIFEYADGELKYNETTGEIFQDGILLAIVPLLNFSQMGALLEPILIGDKKNSIILPLLTDVHKGTSLMLDAYLFHWRKSTDTQDQVVPIS